jgi:hypothetical protein
MAERIVSPGVFTREKDLSFLPQGIGEIGGCIIGPTKTGPAFWPTVISNFDEFEKIFGGLTTETYVPYAAKEYLNGSNRVTIVRTLGRSTIDSVPAYALHYHSSSAGSSNFLDKTVSLIIPSAFEAESQVIDFLTTPKPSGAGVSGSIGGAGVANTYASASMTSTTVGGFVLKLSGSGTTTGFSVLDDKDASGTAYSMSFNTTDANYITNTFGTTANDSKRGFLWTNFKTHQQFSSGSGTGGGIGLAGGVSGSIGTISFPAYAAASTPWITSQLDTINSTSANLFKFHTLAHGTAENWRMKVCIRNISNANPTPAGYGKFDIELRRVNQDYINPIKNGPYTYSTDDVEESWTGVTLDPNDSNYVGRRVGDRYYKIDDEGKLIGYNDYPNRSKYVRVEVTNVVKGGNLEKTLLPFGFRKVVDPIPSTIGTSPSASFVTRQGLAGEWISTEYYGFNYNFNTSADTSGNPAGQDNINYLNVTPASSTQTTGQADFNLSNMYGHVSASVGGDSAAILDTELLTPGTGSIAQRKFAIPFQGGFDGLHPSKYKLTGANMASTNVMGHDISTQSSEGTVAYKRAVDAIANPDEWDINLLITPGLIYTHASVIQNYALRKIEARADAFYLLDVAKFAASPVVSTQITDATADAANFDTSYAACYYPWVKLLDATNDKQVWVPPSVVVGGVIAETDKVSQPWFAPAGLTRGGLTTVLEPATRLTHSERDTLYENRVNPIAAFPGQNVTVWGQKTMQKRPSALDRINVRRLMITVKKFIASSTKFLVFEQNTAATRNRFLGIVNPYLENVQSNSGLYAFKVVMDETNNTPDVIDRNELVGQIFLQPTRTAEFIVLDFNILPTGASFPE